MHNNNNNKEKVNEYIDDLYDAVTQRSTPEQLIQYRRTSDCVFQIYKIIKEHKIKDVDEIIHILVSVLTVPTMMLDRSPESRAESMKQIAIAFLEEIINTHITDRRMNETEEGKEINKLRDMIIRSDTFFGDHKK